MNYPSRHLRGNPLRNIENNFLEDEFFNLPDIFDFSFTNKYMNTDIKENQKEYILEAEIPGFNKDEIDISIDNDYLTISAKSDKRVEEKNKEGYIRKERRYGHFKRSFRLQNVKAEDIKASYENGLLIVHLPKINKNESTSKRIDIN